MESEAHASGREPWVVLSENYSGIFGRTVQMGKSFRSDGSGWSVDNIFCQLSNDADFVPI
jgi:hypothetical protein